MTRPIHRLFGLSVKSDIPLRVPTIGETGSVDLRIFRRPHSSTRGLRQLHTGKSKYSPDGFEVLGDGESLLLRYLELADFLCRVEESSIEVCVHDDSEMEVVETLLVCPVMSIMLKLRNTVCLHASAVSFSGEAIAFTGEWGEGKSTLAAHLVHRGHSLITDDILAVDVACGHVVPSYPKMKLLPEVVRTFGGDPRTLEPVPRSKKVWQPVGKRWGRFSRHSLPLRRVYCLGQASGLRPETASVTSQEAAMSMVRHCYLAGVLADVFGSQTLMHAVGIGAFAPVRSLRTPRGIEHLPLVERAIEQDMATT